jgi:protein tyrosine phosphatase (PTP) superfamily phosphohydrolase (DUF442 family)
MTNTKTVSEQSLEAMKRALFLLESPLLDHCIASSASIPFLRETIARAEAEAAK